MTTTRTTRLMTMAIENDDDSDDNVDTNYDDDVDENDAACGW